MFYIICIVIQISTLHGKEKTMAEEFVTIELSKKQVDTSRLVHNDKTNKDYARVFAPAGGSYLYPVDSIKVKSDNPERVYFTRPVGTEIQVQYSHRNEGVPDTASNEEKYSRETRTWKIEDLKVAYEEERKAYAEQNSSFVNMTVPTNWGTHISNENGNFVSISIPINKVYYSFVVPEERFKDSEKEKGMSYFGFPKHKKDSDEEYMISLRTSRKNEDGEFETDTMVVSSSELKKYVDEAMNYSTYKDMFVTTEISEKLVRNFETKDGKALYSVSVPVRTQAGGEDEFYEIVVPAERVKALDDGKVRLSLFKNGPDGNEYVFTGKNSVALPSGDYDVKELKMTSQDVKKYFDESKERFADSHKNNDKTLAEDMASNEQVQQPFRRHNGR